MSKPFREWDYEDCRKKVAAAIAATVGEAGYQANYLYIEKGDHWQDGKTWPSHHPDPIILQRIRDDAKAMFTPVPTLRECVDSEVDALLETEPTVTFVPREPAKEGTPLAATQAEEAGRLLALASEWWDTAGFWDSVRSAVRYSTWAARGGLRRRLLPSAFERVRRGERETFLLRDGLTLEDALSRVHVSAPLPDQALLYTDPETRERCAIILFSVGEGATEERAAEIWFAEELEGRKVTVRRIVVRGRTDAVAETFAEMEGRLPLAELSADPLVTEAARLQQRRRDYAETVLPRTVQTAGFRERYTTNIEPEVEWTTTKPQGEPIRTWTDPDNGTVFYGIPKPAQLGAGFRADLQGRETTGADGKVMLATPSVTIADPVDPAFVTHACYHARATILETCQQLHALEGDKAAESGYSKKQSRARFEKRVRRKKVAAELMITSTLMGALQDAALMAAKNDPDAALLENYRLSVTLHVDTGPLMPDEAREQRDSVTALLLPRADAMSAAGVEDTRAAHEAILADPIQRLAYRKLQGEVFGAFVTNGTLEGAIVAAELPADVAKALRHTDLPAGEEE